MLGYSEFLAIFEGTHFRKKDLKKFYYAARKSVILRNLGRRSWPNLLKLEETSLWPVLQKIDNPDLPIYRGADKRLLAAFMETIAKEKKIRKERASVGRLQYWSQLRSLIYERADLFAQIFGLCDEDVKHCKIVAQRYEKMLEKKKEEKKKRAWQIGIGAGAATMAGAAAFWFFSRKDKK